MNAETMKKTKKPFSMKKWVKSRNGQQTIVILSFMIIPLLLLFVFTYLPFGEMVKFSFYKMKYATPVDKRQFVGLSEKTGKSGCRQVQSFSFYRF